MCVFVLCPSLQARVESEILAYKDLAALPKVKAIYELRRPDFFSYEPCHRFYSDDRLERLSYGEVLPQWRSYPSMPLIVLEQLTQLV